MNDHQYHELAEQLMLTVEEALDEFEVDIDYESASGILTLIFEDGSKIIINKQAPLQQVWVATKFNGHHFSYQQEKWIDERSGAEFWAFMDDAVSKQAGATLSFGNA